MERAPDVQFDILRRVFNYRLVLARHNETLWRAFEPGDVEASTDAAAMTTTPRDGTRTGASGVSIPSTSGRTRGYRRIRVRVCVAERTVAHARGRRESGRVSVWDADISLFRPIFCSLVIERGEPSTTNDTRRAERGGGSTVMRESIKIVDGPSRPIAIARARGTSGRCSATIVPRGSRKWPTR